MSENHWIENNRRVIEEFHTNGGRVQRWPPFPGVIIEYLPL